MWLLIFAGLLAVSAGKEAATAAEKAETLVGKADDIVVLEIETKEPTKRSPIQASTVYGSSPSQYIVRHGDDAQELSPEYLAVLRRYTQSQLQSYASPTAAPAQHAGPTRRPLPAYARQQQQLQQAYYNTRKPAVVPPRPQVQLHPQALVQAEVAAQYQAQTDDRNRADAIHIARLPNPAAAQTHQVPTYSDPKLGTFEQELLQLVSANQAQEFKLIPTQPKRPVNSAYSQQLVSYPAQYTKAVTAAPTPAHSGLPEQYHIETTAPRYRQPVAASYQQIAEPVQYQAVQHQAVQHQAVQHQAVQQVQPAKDFRPSPQYDYPEDDGLDRARLRAEADAASRAQAHAEAQALAFQKVNQESHQRHIQNALEQIRIVNERHRQQSALEQIQEGSGVSEAGRSHIEEQYYPKNPEAAYRARLKAQAAAEAAEARRVEEAAGFKAHSDAILKLQAQQQAHVKAQEQAHINALNFEKNQLRAQAQAQAIAQAQAEALYAAYQKERQKANKEVLAAARAQHEARKLDPENTPVIQYLLPNSTPLPSPNSYFTNDQVQKYQTSGSSYVPRSVAPNASPDDEGTVFVSPSSVPIPAKKTHLKSFVVEDVVEKDPENGEASLIRVSGPKGQRELTREELSALVNAGYTVTPAPRTLLKKQRDPINRPEYVTYEEVLQRPRKPTKKSGRISKLEGGDSEKITYLVPLEPVFGSRQIAEE